MYKIIFDNLTAEALKKFLKISGDNSIKKTLNKVSLATEIQEKISVDSEFLKAFHNFFNEIEKAGRKDFWFCNLRKDLDPNEISSLRKKLSKFKRDSDDIFVPATEGAPEYFDISKNDNIIEVKVIRKKIIKEQVSSQNRTEGDYFFVAYKLTEIRHVSYYKLDLSKNNKFMFGIDIWQNLTTKLKLKEAQTDIEKIFGKSFWDNLKFIVLKSFAQTILNDMGNVITRELKDKISNRNQSVGFYIDKEKVNVIKKELNDGKVLLANVKTAYIDVDVRNNEAFLAAQGKNIDLSVSGGKGVFYYYSSLISEFDFFRFEIFSAESRIKLINDHIMYEDIKDVFSKII